jgi:hypothetical protein
LDIRESLNWPMHDKGWIEKILLIGLIALIPIVGTINLYGWMLSVLDNLRAGQRRLPPAGFYLERGTNLFVVRLLYGIAIYLVLGAVAGTILLSLALQHRLGLAAVLVTIAIAYPLAVMLGILLGAVDPLIAVATERGGIAGGLDPTRVLRLFNENPAAARYAALGGLAGYLILVAGSILSIVGLVFTLPFGEAVIARAISNFEQATSHRANTA